MAKNTDKKFMGIVTADPLYITDYFKHYLDISYIHLGGSEEPGLENSYITLSKISKEHYDILKRKGLTKEFVISDDITESRMRDFIKERANPSEITIYIPKGESN